MGVGYSNDGDLPYLKNFDKIEREFCTRDREGATGYIDYIKRDEVSENKMRGYDTFRRKFIILKVGIEQQDELIETGQVFFQRYSDRMLWMGALFEGTFIETCGGVTEQQFNLLDDIIDNKVIILKEEHRPSSQFVPGSRIASMDYWNSHPL